MFLALKASDREMFSGQYFGFGFVGLFSRKLRWPLIKAKINPQVAQRGNIPEMLRRGRRSYKFAEFYAKCDSQESKYSGGTENIFLQLAPNFF